MKIVPLQTAKQRLEQKQHASLVLKAFDDLKHADAREAKDRKAEVERKAREAL